jgi:hypothetical protein
MNADRSHVTMRFSSCAALLAACLFAGEATAQSQAIVAPSEWQNQAGSLLRIDAIDGSGKLSGSYVNRAAGFRCQNIAYAVSGVVYGNAVAFTVKWANEQASCGSVTTWAGYLADGALHTRWLLIRDGGSSDEHLLRGESTFRR